MSNNHIPMGLRHGAVVGVLLFAGCLVKDPYYCGDGDGHCELEGFPFCDVDGSISGMDGPRCIAVECDPLQFKACRGDEALVCNTTGDNYDVTHCEFGCNAETGGCNACRPGTSECEAHIIPKYLPTICDGLAPTPNLTISESITLDTSNNMTCSGGVVAQTTGPEICVLWYGTITINRNQTLTVKGSRALALVADYALIIDGTLDVSANLLTPGPGGGFVKVTYPPAPSGNTGVGGTGFKTRGGAGGDENAIGGANNGTAPLNDPAFLVDLVGGPGGATPENLVPAGAAGGGATAISCRGTVSLLGMIDAGGGGGASGGAFLFTTSSAGGGGAGGYVVLQGMMIEITGFTFANGGGGGAGAMANQGNIDPTAPGSDGTRSALMPAPGGPMQGPGQGIGGTGGVGNVLPGPGGRSSSAASGAGGGGGGGSVGFFQTYTPMGVVPTITPAAASPAFQPSLSIETR